MPSTKHPIVPFEHSGHDHDRCVDLAVANAEAACVKRGLRLTPTRRRVLELVWDSHSPIKAYDILQRLQQERGPTAPPTVYRALDFLLDAGLVHRIESLNSYIGCGCGNKRLPHAGQFLICRQCQTVAEIDDPGITRALIRSAAELEFKVGAQYVEVAGLCPTCDAVDGSEETPQ